MRFDKHDCGPGSRHRGFKMAMMARGFGRGFGAGFGEGFGDGFGGWDGDGPPHRGRGGRFGGRGRMFGPGELRLYLLHLVAQADRHGYELIKAIEELTGGNYAPSPGVVYPTLALLVDEGLIAEIPEEGARKAFTATEAGRAELAARTEEADAIAERLKALAQPRAEPGSPPVRRAVANLMIALRQRASGGMETEIAHQVADILDEAARRIERL